MVPVASRASLRPSFLVLTLFAVSAAGCSSDTSRFDNPFSNPFASRPQASAGDVTGSVNAAPPSRVETRALPAPGQMSAPLPPPTRPAAVQSSSGISGGGKGIAAYQPGYIPQQDITGSVNKPPPPPAPVAPAWNWE